jgi:hypothetical protein
VSGCKVDADGPHFKALCRRYQKTFPGITKDLKDAFDAIAQDINAKNAARYQSGASYEIYKYRQNSRDIKRGASYGWRIYAFYEKKSGRMLPFLIFPKTEMDDANDATILASLRDIKSYLGYCLKEGCIGVMAPKEPQEISHDGSVRTACPLCGVQVWKEAEA